MASRAIADEQIRLTQAAMALMKSANDELQEQRDICYKACKEFLASDFAKAFKAIEAAVKRAEETGVV